MLVPFVRPPEWAIFQSLITGFWHSLLGIFFPVRK